MFLVVGTFVGEGIHPVEQIVEPTVSKLRRWSCCRDGSIWRRSGSSWGDRCSCSGDDITSWSSGSGKPSV